MIVNPEWLKPKEKPYFHQISMDCLEKLVKYIEQCHNMMDAVITLKNQNYSQGKRTELILQKTINHNITISHKNSILYLRKIGILDDTKANRFNNDRRHPSSKI